MDDIDSLVTHLHTRIVKLEKFIKDDNSDKLSILSEVFKIKIWLIEDASLQMHKCIQSYMTHLWRNYGTDYKSRKGFVMHLKYMIGFAEISEKLISIDSLSFGACSNKKRFAYLEELKKFAMKQFGDDFQAWYDYWIENPQLI